MHTYNSREMSIIDENLSCPFKKANSLIGTLVIAAKNCARNAGNILKTDDSLPKDFVHLRIC